MTTQGDVPVDRGGNDAIAKAINERLRRDPMPIGDFLFADEQAVLDAIPVGWCKTDDGWVLLSLEHPGRGDEGQ